MKKSNVIRKHSTNICSHRFIHCGGCNPPNDYPLLSTCCYGQEQIINSKLIDTVDAETLILWEDQPALALLYLLRAPASRLLIITLKVDLNANYPTSAAELPIHSEVITLKYFSNRGWLLKEIRGQPLNILDSKKLKKVIENTI